MDPSNIARLPPYSMNHKSRGPVLIFSNKTYPDSMRLPERLFNDIDVANLMKCFRTLGYKDIRLKMNLTAQQVFQEIENVARSDHSQNDSVVIVFLCYGEQNLVYLQDRHVGVQVLVESLKGDMCHPSLIGKPKLIISQTCNPDMVLMENSDGDDDDDGKLVRHVIPSEADFFYIGSEVPALMTNRECKQGSLFITSLCRRFGKDGTNVEIRTLGTRTLQDVEMEMDKWNASWAEANDARMPYMVSMLTRDLYFPSTV